jgi:hypothetical protein
MECSAVDYCSLIGVDGEFFKCEKMLAVLSVEACVQRWLKYSDSDGYATCRDCKIGACHAGVEYIQKVPSTCCVRCGRTDQRLIRRQICISCYNREREYLRGENAKGSFPRDARPIQEMVVNTTRGSVVVHCAVDQTEAVLLALRENPGCSVGLTPPPVREGQLVLF